ncbi:transketolase family protein [Listeria aquatica]|uniref:transketolase family protein n=1 Tax=Listeria aquatica TaxID=1494960 RepID=UPI003EF11909
MTIELSEKEEYGIELRNVVANRLEKLMEQDDRIIALDADLSAASNWNKLQETHPNQFINVGVSEANMVGMASGLSIAGFIPFIHSFGPFVTRRVFDQLYLSGGYAKTTINIYGSDPGFAVGPNGGTHTTLEDVALMRSIPHAIVCDACCAVQMDWIINEFSKHEGIHYVRGNRKSVHEIYQPGTTFELGRGNVLRTGTDGLLVVSGQLVYEALKVAEHLARKGVSLTVIDMFTIKPLDKELLLKESQDKKFIVTLENHSIIGGLGSAVSEACAESALAIPLKRVGIEERFGEVGTPDYLQETFGLTTEKIEERIQDFLNEINH